MGKHYHDHVVLVSVYTLCTIYCVVVFDTPAQARVKSSGQLIALKLIKLEPGIEYGEQCYTTQCSVQGPLGHALAMYESLCKQGRSQKIEEGVCK